MTEQITWTNTTVQLGQLKPWADNPRQSTKKQAEKLLQSWRKFGQVETVAVSPDMGVYNGHQRLSALLTVYGADYVIEARQASRHLTEAEKRELTITLHAGAVGSWSWDDLASWEPTELKEWGFDDSLLSNWRLDVASLGNFLESEEAGKSADAEPQIDRAAELREQWGVESGQLWRMESRTPGNFHLLICGDCTDAGVVERVMMGEKADGCFTSPPYAEQRVHIYDSIPEVDYVGWWAGVQENIKTYLSDSGSFFVNIKPHSKDYERSLYVMDLCISMTRLWGWRYLEEFCWLRPGIPGDPEKMGKFKNQFEPVHHFSVGDYKFIPKNVMHDTDSAILDDNYDPGFGRNYQGKGENRFGKREIGKGKAYPGNVIKTQGNEAFGHEAAFPVGLPEFFIKAYSCVDDIWLEPFSGSGTVFVAAENLSRQCRAIEIAPGYVAVALQRYHDAFGITAELIDTI